MSNPILDPKAYPAIPENLLRNARVLPDRIAALALWPKEAVIAEIGVALGDFSTHILRVCQPRRFIAIDRFDLHQLPALWGVPTEEHFGGLTHEAFYRGRFAAEIASGQVEPMQGDSVSVIASLPDRSVDLFYVDADHSYAGVWADLNAILPKVRPDGWIIMNDYIPAEIGLSNEPFGVIQATNEFMATHGWEMVYFALAYVMYCDVGLRRVGSWRPMLPDCQAQDSRIASLEHDLRAVRQSTSWRVTAPLRAIGTMVKRRTSR